MRTCRLSLPANVVSLSFADFGRAGAERQDLALPFHYAVEVLLDVLAAWIVVGEAYQLAPRRALGGMRDFEEPLEPCRSGFGTIASAGYGSILRPSRSLMPRRSSSCLSWLSCRPHGGSG